MPDPNVCASALPSRSQAAAPSRQRARRELGQDHSRPSRTRLGPLGTTRDHPGAPLPTPPPPRAPSAAGEAAGPARLGPSRKADAGLSAPWDRPGRWGLREGTRRGRGCPGAERRPGTVGGCGDPDRIPQGDPTRTETPARSLYGAVATTDLGGGQVARANLWRGSFFRLQVLKLESGYCGEETWRHQRRDRSGHARGGGEGIQNKSPAARLMIVNNVPSGSFNLLSPGVFNWSKAQFGRKGEFRLSGSPAWRR